MNYADRAKDITTTTGTGSITLAAASPAGSRQFSAAFAVGSKNIPYLVDDNAGNWEIGMGTLSASTTLTRDVVYSSSNAGAKVNFGAGTKTVSCVLPASVLSSVAVDPDDVGFDVILLVGQSNMVGSGSSDVVLDTIDSRVWQYGNYPSDADRYHRIEQVHGTLAFNENGSSKLSPAPWLARAYAASIPANRHVLLVPAAVSATGFDSWQPYWVAPSGPACVAAIAAGNAAVAAALALYPKSRFVGIAWIQGESDSNSESNNAAAYRASWISLMDTLKSSITGAANAWVVIGSMVREFINDWGPNPAASRIDGAHESLPRLYPHTAYVRGPAGMNVGDDVHYNAQGARILGSGLGLAVRAASLNLHYGAAVVLPSSPPAVSATAGNASASVAFEPSISNGGGDITAYTVTSSPGGHTGTGATSPINVTGLTNGTEYSFTVTAENSAGTSAPSAASNSVTPAAGASVPGAPTIGAATGGNASASVAFTPPASNGGSAITGYTVTSSPGGHTGTGATSPINVTGLTNGTAYTFTAHATNVIGNSAESAASNSVTPSAGGGTYTTWNPSDKASGISLSNGNLTFNATDTGFMSLRGVAGKTTGKYYAELTFGSGDPCFGIGNSSASLATFGGADAHAIAAFSNNGRIHLNSQEVGNLGAWNPGDIVSMAVDMDADEITFKRNNGTGVTLSFSSISGTMYPIGSSLSNGTTSTANFGASAFAYTPPAGYTGWSA